MESDLHLELKRCARAWLEAAGAGTVAVEVRTAIPFWRADVAAWIEGSDESFDRIDALPKARIESMAREGKPGALLFENAPNDPLGDLLRRAGAVDLFGNPDPAPSAAVQRGVARRVRTALVECKASRSDFLSDRADLDAAAAAHQRMQRRRDRIREQLLPRWEPHLRRTGETLFPETDGWNVQHSRLASVRSADRDERLARAVLESQAKFDRLARWRLADRLYLCTPGGLLKAHEVPADWGWLEVTRGAIRLRRSARVLHSSEPRRWRTVCNIQRAAARP